MTDTAWPDGNILYMFAINLGKNCCMCPLPVTSGSLSQGTLGNKIRNIHTPRLEIIPVSTDGVWYCLCSQDLCVGLLQ